MYTPPPLLWLLLACQDSPSAVVPPAAAPTPVLQPVFHTDVPLPTSAAAGALPIAELVHPIRDTSPAQLREWCEWRSGGPAPTALAQWMQEGVFGFGVLEVDAAGLLNLHGQTVEAEDLSGQLMAYRMRWEEVVSNCADNDAPYVPVLAIDASAQLHMVVPVLQAATAANLSHLFVLVSGSAGAPHTLSHRPEAVQIHLTPTTVRRNQQSLPLPPPEQPLPLEMLGVAEGALGCAIISQPTAAHWQNITDALDRTASVGGRRAVLIQDEHLPQPPTQTPTGTPLTEKAIDGSVAVHLLDVPVIRMHTTDTPPEGTSHCEPIVYLHVSPSPTQPPAADTAEQPSTP